MYWLRQKREAHPMVPGRPVRRYRRAVFHRRVALVHRPVEVRVLGVHGAHHFIAVGFGQNAGGSDAAEFPIALDDATVRDAEVGREAVAVDEQQFGSCAQRINGPVHGEEGCVQDVDAVYLLHRGVRDAPSDGVLLDQRTELFALRFLKLLRVVQARKAYFLRKDDRGRNDRSRQAAPPGLVASGFQQPTRMEGGEFHRAAFLRPPVALAEAVSFIMRSMLAHSPSAVRSQV